MRCFFVLTTLVLATTLPSCKDNEEKDLVNEVNKNGSIATSVSVAHLDSTHDILTTKHIVWANGVSAKEIESLDTIPSLGYTTAQDEESENSKPIQIQKAYEIFITIK